MELGTRLKAVANLVPANLICADIGTDHAYLPVYLVEQGRVQAAIASDNKRGPCEAASKTVEQHNLKNKIQVRLGQGLATVKLGEVQCITIAGMGGLTMLSILEEAQELLTDEYLKYLVLQPQTDGDRVRQWAEKHGWGITAEDLVEDGNKLYEMFRLERNSHYVYTGKSYEIGQLLIDNKHPLLEKKLCKMMQAYTASLAGMEQGRTAAESAQYKLIKNKLEKLKEIYDENYSC